jgi:hypothetical protein
MWVLHQGPHYSIKFNIKRRFPFSSLALLYSGPQFQVAFEGPIYNHDAGITNYNLVTTQRRHGLRNIEFAP